jgi:predicted RNase H-like HicB family nuclease
VQSQIEACGQTIADENIRVGPSDYVPWQKDNKICFIRIESKHFGDMPMNLELRLSVEDSPNSAGVAIDSIRCLKLALDNKLSGPIVEPAAYFQKHPPKQIEDRTARALVEKFITKYGRRHFDQAGRTTWRESWYNLSMKRATVYQSVVYKEGKYYGAQCLNVDVSSFGETEQEALTNLQEALELYLEDAPAESFAIEVTHPSVHTVHLQHA